MIFIFYFHFSTTVKFLLVEEMLSMNSRELMKDLRCMNAHGLQMG